MNKSEITYALLSIRGRLVEEVFVAYRQRGDSFGDERFSVWRRQLEKLLDKNFPGYASRLKSKLDHAVMYRSFDESDYDVFLREKGHVCLAFIDSLKLDLDNDEFEFDESIEQSQTQSTTAIKEPSSNRVFVVHGHDESLKVNVARFIEKLGYEAVILHERANRGQTVIEKIESNTDVGFAIILYSPDDLAQSKAEAEHGKLRFRARQNVVFEHGYLIAKLGRSRVATLVTGELELPSDISGVVFVNSANWQINVAKEMKAAGYLIDFNRLMP